MPSHKWSKGAAKALKLIEKNRKKDLDDALGKIDEEPGAPVCAGRNKSVKARIHVELWRNGWAGVAALDEARTLAESGLNADKGDFYTNWKMAYALKYRARSQGWNNMTTAMAHYDRAIESLEADAPTNVDAMRCLLIDRAEAYVYMSKTTPALTGMQRAMDLGKTPAPQPWHHWAYAFALHQAGQYKEAIDRLAMVPAGKPDDLYYNDMRLLLAASQARAGNGAEANKTIGDFHKLRDKEHELVWSIPLELERGAFSPGGPGEMHWRASLELLDPKALPR